MKYVGELIVVHEGMIDTFFRDWLAMMYLRARHLGDFDTLRLGIFAQLRDLVTRHIN
jgi:hypothetical protein